MGKEEVVLNKPIIIGACVLGLSKLNMYEFWYDYVKIRIMLKGIPLLYGYQFIHIQSRNRRYLPGRVKNVDLFDFSNYPHSTVSTRWVMNK